MAGKIIADTIETGSGDDISTSYVVNGSAKMFIAAADGLASILKSMNVSSLDDDGTGDGGVNLTSSMDGVNYAVCAGMEDKSSVSVVADATVTTGTQAASSFDFETAYVNSGTNRTNEDRKVYFSILGDLA